MRYLLPVIAACAFTGSAPASALLVTEACKLVTAQEMNAVMGAMSEGAGTSDGYLVTCSWSQEDGDAWVYFYLYGEEMFTPSGRTAIDQLESDVAVVEGAGNKVERIPGLGDAAVVFAQADKPEVVELYVASKGDLLTILISIGTKDKIIALAKAAAARMGR